MVMCVSSCARGFLLTNCSRSSDNGSDMMSLKMPLRCAPRATSSYHAMDPQVNPQREQDLVGFVNKKIYCAIWHFLFISHRVSNAGRRTDFRDKKSRDFSGEIFLERNYCRRTVFSGSNP